MLERPVREEQALEPNPCTLSTPFCMRFANIHVSLKEGPCFASCLDVQDVA